MLFSFAVIAKKRTFAHEKETHKLINQINLKQNETKLT